MSDSTEPAAAAAATSSVAKADDVLKVKVILLGDSAVGKSKLVERFLMDGYKPQQQSTYALTWYRYKTTVKGQAVEVDFWDTAGQERFQSMHPSYYHQAQACLMVFDATRKITYKNLANWYKELREHRPEIPCLVVANKIDADMSVTKRAFNFPKKHRLPFYFVSASDGTNVVKIFRDTIKAAVAYKLNTTDVLDQMLEEVEALVEEGGMDTFDQDEEGTRSSSAGEVSPGEVAS